MGTGFFQASVTAGTEAIPIYDADVAVFQGVHVLSELRTNKDGDTESVPIDAPDRTLTYVYNYEGQPYSTVDVSVKAEHFIPRVIRDVSIFDGEYTILPVNMTPDYAFCQIEIAGMPNEQIQLQNNVEYIDLPRHSLSVKDSVPIPNAQINGNAAEPETDTRVDMDTRIEIPLNITVHLGPPHLSATDVTIPFRDYIKNVTSSIIYPTWPYNALEANIYVFISVALNRIYTNWYRNQGYTFDITFNPSYDQLYVYQGNIFANISDMVDDLFNRYLHFEGSIVPVFVRHQSTITDIPTPGAEIFSYWGSHTLARLGKSAIDIVRYFYLEQINVGESNNLLMIRDNFPGRMLSLGDKGVDVQAMQNYLNVIGKFYPSVPPIIPANGMFVQSTRNAVVAVQKIRSVSPPPVSRIIGIVDKATWYKIAYLYTAVVRLIDLKNESEIIVIDRNPPTITIAEGATGANVGRLQLMLNFCGCFYPELLPVVHDFRFGRDTTDSVRSFQKAFEIGIDGVVGPVTWRRLYEIYWDIMDAVFPEEPPEPPVPPLPPDLPPFPGTLLRFGSRGEDVMFVQDSLNIIRRRYPIIQNLVVDGIFGANTQNAVITFQRVFGLVPDGIVGPITWDKMMQVRYEVGTDTALYNPGLFLLEGASQAAAGSSGKLPACSGAGALTVNNNALNPDIALLLTLLLIKGICGAMM